MQLGEMMALFTRGEKRGHWRMENSLAARVQENETLGNASKWVHIHHYRRTLHGHLLCSVLDAVTHTEFTNRAAKPKNKWVH